jgi:AcrR family transcriptional regulator
MSKGEDTRAAILDRAASLASRVGLEALSIGGLADEMGMSKSGLFAHFGSKEALQLNALEHAAGQFIERVLKPAFTAPRGEPRIRALFELWLRWAEATQYEGGCLFVQAATEYDDRPGLVRDLVWRQQSDWIATLATSARLAIEEGHFREDLEPEQFAYEFYALAVGYHYMHRLLREPRAEERIRTAFVKLLADARNTP